jgi:sulfate adenylyltransferase large subunit
MAHQSALIAEDIHAYLKSQEEKSLLRFITCGSVDDGKSTLIGRLLWDSKMVFEDQLATLQSDSKKVGTQNGNIDYALLLDGLQAEREQGITIDVAYRFFSTDKRKFIVADTPGHEQYTRNMVTGASNAQVAVILVDARKGVLTQTKRHSYLVSLVGIRKVVLAINKMDLVDYSAERFEQIRQEYEAFVAGLGFSAITAIPLSALEGDNMIEPSPNTPWYQGPTLLQHLETVEVVEDAGLKPFRMRVQWVNRPNLDFRGFCGTIASGVVRPGDEVVVSASGRKSRVKSIVTMDGELPAAGVGQAVTLTLADEIDLSRGDTLASPQEPPYYADRLEAKLVWLHEEPLQPGQSYLLKAGSSTSPAKISELKFKINVNRLEQENGTELALNEVGVCSFHLDRPISFDSYRENRATGSFILIDRLTNATVGAGMIHQPLRRPTGQNWQQLEINRTLRGELLHQTPEALWFVGQIPEVVREVAAQTAKKLHSLGRHTYLLDRDSDPQHTAELVATLVDAGLIVLVPLALGNQAERNRIQADTPGRAIYFDLPGAGGDAFEAPDQPALTVNKTDSADAIAEQIARELFK